MPPASAAKTGWTCRTSIAMRNPPSAPAKMLPPAPPVNRPEFGPAGRDGADGCHQLVAQLGQWQRNELFLEAKRHDPVHGREQRARQGMACIRVELRQQGY